jgi:predicted dehydrogenase
MIRTARENECFLMEAMWSRYLPTLAKTRELIGAGKIGDVRLIQADFGFRTHVNPEGRLFNLSLGGGALLDVGIYPLSLAHMILGTPSGIASSASIGSTGVDEQTALLLTYDRGQMALLSTAIRTSTPHEATIIGTDGWIQIHRQWWISDTLTIYAEGEKQTIHCPVFGNGYNYEAEEVGKCIRSGKLESDVMSLDETLSLMQVLDRIRQQIGLRYPADQVVS